MTRNRRWSSRCSALLLRWSSRVAWFSSRSPHAFSRHLSAQMRRLALNFSKVSKLERTKVPPDPDSSVFPPDLVVHLVLHLLKPAAHALRLHDQLVLPHLELSHHRLLLPEAAGAAVSSYGTACWGCPLFTSRGSYTWGVGLITCWCPRTFSLDVETASSTVSRFVRVFHELQFS